MYYAFNPTTGETTQLESNNKFNEKTVKRPIKLIDTYTKELIAAAKQTGEYPQGKIEQILSKIRGKGSYIKLFEALMMSNEHLNAEFARTHCPISRKLIHNQPEYVIATIGACEVLTNYIPKILRENYARNAIQEINIFYKKGPEELLSYLIGKQ